LLVEAALQGVEFLLDVLTLGRRALTLLEQAIFGLLAQRLPLGVPERAGLLELPLSGSEALVTRRLHRGQRLQLSRLLIDLKADRREFLTELIERLGVRRPGGGLRSDPIQVLAKPIPLGPGVFQLGRRRLVSRVQVVADLLQLLPESIALQRDTFQVLGGDPPRRRLTRRCRQTGKFLRSLDRERVLAPLATDLFANVLDASPQALLAVGATNLDMSRHVGGNSAWCATGPTWSTPFAHITKPERNLKDIAEKKSLERSPPSRLRGTQA